MSSSRLLSNRTILTSAKTGTFVDTAFLMMAHEIKNKMNNVPGSSGGTKVSGGDGDKKGCC